MSTHLDERGVVRQDHYGAGRQPWDDVLDEGWAPEACAHAILKYLRRTKAPEHSLESARWFYDRLYELSRGDLLPRSARPGAAHENRNRSMAMGRASAVLARLREVLTPEEIRSLR